MFTRSAVTFCRVWTTCRSKVTGTSACWVFLLAIVCGCGGKKDLWERERPPLYRAAGMVSYKGEPVEGAHVTFHPVQKGPGAFGRTNAQGVFELQTFETKDGAAAGEYVVTVELKAVSEGDAVSQTSGADAFKAMELQAKQGIARQANVKVESLLPEHYADAKQSGLKVTVAVEGGNDFEIQLTD